MIQQGVKVGGKFKVICRNPEGIIAWDADAPNLVVNAGLQHILNTIFSASAQTATWYVGLCASSPTVASGDTMITHAGWTEFINYDETTRQEWVEVRTNQSMTNSGTKAAVTVSTNTSIIGGAFLTSSNTKSGTAGTLMCAAAFTGGNKAADDNDTLEVQYTFTAGDDGA